METETRDAMIGLAIIVGIIALFLVPYCFFIRSVQLTLRAVPDQQRKMEPAMPWLLLIPLFNFVWIFIVVNGVTDSFKALEKANLLKRKSDASYGVGLAYAITLATSWIPLIGALTGIACFVLWIIYWVGIVDARRDILDTPRLPAA
jgi:hypothetical protein